MRPDHPFCGRTHGNPPSASREEYELMPLQHRLHVLMGIATGNTREARTPCMWCWNIFRSACDRAH